VGVPTVSGSIRGATIVAVGTVVGKEFETLLDSEQLELLKPDTSSYKTFPYRQIIAKYKVVIRDLFKGKDIADTITLYTGVTGGDCGIRFTVGGDYIFYADKKTYFGQMNNNWKYPEGPGIYWTNSCTRTQSVNDTELNEIKAEIKVK